MSRSASNPHAEVDPEWSRARNELFRMIMEGRSFSGRERNCLFLNPRGKRFATLSAISGIDFPDDARGIAVTDWDDDGDLDLWLSNRNAPRLRLMRNNTPADNHFLAIQLVGNGVSTNRDAIGARVTVITQNPSDDQRQQTQAQTLSLRAGEGFLSQSSKTLHFGLGAAQKIQRVLVQWPDGTQQAYEALRVDRRYRLLQGRERPEPLHNRNGALAIQASAPPILPEPTRVARVVMASRVPMPEIAYLSSEGDKQLVTFGNDAPVLVNLWASWCTPCWRELNEFKDSAKQLRQCGLRVVSLSVDGISDKDHPARQPAEIARLLEQMDYPFASGLISRRQLQRLQELTHQFFFLRQPLPLPSSFLIDRSGRLAIIYKGPVSVAQLLEDVNSTIQTGPQPAQIACLPGLSLTDERVVQIDRQTDLQQRYRVAAWLEASGELAEAIRHLEAITERHPNWSLGQSHLADLYVHQGPLDKALQRAELALDLDPENVRALNTLGLIHARQSNPETAIAHFRKAIRLDPEFPGAYNNVGILLAMQGQLQRAGRAFQKAVELDPRFADAHANLGNVFAALRRTEQAVHHYQAAIEINPQKADSYSNLGTLYGRLGKLDQAVEYYRKALEVDPDNRGLQRNLQRALELQRRQAVRESRD